jgi:hypothetical protein
MLALQGSNHLPAKEMSDSRATLLNRGGALLAESHGALYPLVSGRAPELAAFIECIFRRVSSII